MATLELLWAIVYITKSGEETAGGTSQKAGMLELMSGEKTEKPEKPASFVGILKGVEWLAEVDSAE